MTDDMMNLRARYMTLESVGHLSDDPSSACQPWRADQPGLAGQHGGQCHQLNHPVGHYR
jgi:hypothetical protein